LRDHDFIFFQLKRVRQVPARNNPGRPRLFAREGSSRPSAPLFYFTVTTRDLPKVICANAAEAHGPAVLVERRRHRFIDDHAGAGAPGT
jgi:hypothetical protein